MIKLTAEYIENVSQGFVTVKPAKGVRHSLAVEARAERERTGATPFEPILRFPRRPVLVPAGYQWYDSEVFFTDGVRGGGRNR